VHENCEGYCGYVDPASGQGVCTAEGNGSFAYPFAPMDAILAEIPSQYRTTAQFLVPPSKFRNSGYETATSRAGFYFIFIGSVATGVTFLASVIRSLSGLSSEKVLTKVGGPFSGLIRHDATFTIAFVSSVVASLMLLIGASILTALIQQTESINKYKVSACTRTPVNISPKISTIAQNFRCTMLLSG
jgi:hypothetical protein